MRFDFVYALFVATAVAIPFGVSKTGIEVPATSSKPMSMPTKRATPTAHATPSASASASGGMEKPMKAEKLMMLF
ncbi:uncharacterized protein N7498_009145 [Penicillium cinerascens]|uniref:Uncharacterized protein n=1 Tax=Penicillium cinerascens TaxID=70096 RepID=A0A9W9J4D0_9EURO|nr:uncharacterized protein N7498_009145 [Penicillium cinerascens]KAJ5190160.1 hypothetical protein N7498_009145 [Penicillium cinerascens]